MERKLGQRLYSRIERIARTTLVYIRRDVNEVNFRDVKRFLHADPSIVIMREQRFHTPGTRTTLDHPRGAQKEYQEGSRWSVQAGPRLDPTSN
jgi:hypothetical protein